MFAAASRKSTFMVFYDSIDVVMSFLQRFNTSFGQTFYHFY